MYSSKGLKEIANANKVAGHRDAGFIEQAKITPVVVEEDESKGSTHWIFIIYNIYLYIMNDK